jgi:hypothetical protein
MHVLRVVCVLLAVAIVAAVVGAASSVLSARPDLQKAKRSVDTSWSTLSPRLDQRYTLLATVDLALQPVPGPVHSLVGAVDTEIAHWKDARAHSGIAAQVNAANALEALARRLVATASVSPRVRTDAAALQAMNRFLGDGGRADAANVFNATVTSYEHERSGPVRAIVASLLGDGSIPALDTTPTSDSSAVSA